MTDAGFFRGTSSEQDNRFSDKEKKLMKQMKFADSILKKVDMSKVNLSVLKPWISNRISELLGMEDDVLNEFVFNQLEADNNPDGRRIQINLTGFLNGKNARVFTGELWEMLLDAMEHSGVPAALLNAKKAEISQRLIQAEEEKPKKLESTVRNSDDDRKSYHGSSRHHYDNDRDRDRYSHQTSKNDDSFGRDRRRFDDDSGDRHRSHATKKSRFSDIQPDQDEIRSSHDSGRDSNRVKEPIRDDELKKPERIDDDDDGTRVEMKKRKKNKHRHHRKRRSSSSSGNSEDDDEEDDRGRQKHRRSSNSDKRKKKKSKRSKHSRSSDHSEERNLEQELRDRALESMRKQKTMDK